MHRSPLLPLSLSPSLLVIFALALRLWGISWSLPNQDHLYTYHPDEGVNLVSAVLENGRDPRPHIDLNFYNYGGLYFYLWQGAVAVNRTYGFIQLPPTGMPNEPLSDSRAALILVGRLLTALLGALTVWAVFALGNRLFGRKAGLLASAIYALMPAAVVHAHYATVDVPVTFFVTVALVYGARLLAVQRGREGEGKRGRMSPLPLFTSSPLHAGFFSGLAAATKYNCGLVLLAPLAALYLRRRLAGGVARWEPWGVVGMAAVGFLVGCPGILANWPTFWRDFTFEMAKSRRGIGWLFADTGNGWLYHLTSSLRFGLGVPLLLLSLGALGFALFRRTRQDWYLLAFLVPYYFVIGSVQVRFLRYILPLLPVLAVLIARFLTERWPERPAVSRALSALGATILLGTLLLTMALDRLMALPDARDQAYAYIRANIPPGRLFAFATTPWYYTPPLSPGFTRIDPRTRRLAARDTAYTPRLPAEGREWDMAVFDPPLPDHVLLSDIESEDPLRLNLPDARRFMEVLRTHYAARDFQNTPSIFGLDFGKPAYVPNDWLYIYPRVTLYTKR